MLINLFVLPLFIKNLGAELYGIWILSGVVLGYAGVFDFGFTQGLQKYVAEARVKKDDQELSEVVVTGLGILTILGVCIGAVIYWGAPAIVGFFNIEAEQAEVALQLLRISALFSVVMWPLRIVDVVLNASMQIKELSLLNGFKSIIQSIVMLVMIVYSFEIIQIKWVVASLVFAVALYGIALLKKYAPEVCWDFEHFKFHQISRMQGFSLGIFYAGVIGLFSVQIDTLIIGRFLSMSAVTAYVIAAKPFHLIQQVGGLLMRVVTPASYTLGAQKDVARLSRLVTVGVRVRSLTVIPICFVAFICVPDFILLWVGNNYSNEIIWAQAFLLVPILACLGVGAHVCKGVGGIALINNFSTAKIALNLVISIILLPHFGVGGPILGTILSNLLLGDCAAFWAYCRYIGVSSRAGYGFFFQVLFVSLVAYIITYLGFRMWMGEGGTYSSLFLKATLAVVVQSIAHVLFCLTKTEKGVVVLRVKQMLVL